jgi:hypothetical protein
MTQRPVYLHDMSIVLPNIIKLDVRDGTIGRRRIEAEPSPPNANAPGAWIPEGDTYFTVIGKNRSYKRYADVPPIAFLDRDAADDAANWAVSGGLTVNAVHRYTTPQQQGEWAGQTGGNFAKFIQMRHHLYLELDADLVEGTEYTITFPTELSLPDYVFTYYPIGTRCSAIAVNQVGYGQNDTAKHAYISEWIPGYGTEGAVSFSSVTDWHIIDRNGNIVWSAGAAPDERINPSSSELTAIYMEPNDKRLTSTTTPVRAVTGISNTNPAVLTYTGDNFSNDMIIRIEDVRMTSGGLDTTFSLNSGGSPYVPNDFIIKNINNAGPKTFELWKYPAVTAYDRSASTGVYRSGGVIYQTHTTNNRYCTYVYDLDFSAFEPATAGIYYVYVEGVGISYPFLIDNAVHHEVANSFAAGEYHHRHDTECDGRFGWTQPKGYNSTSTQHKVYDNLLPLGFSSEIGIADGGDPIQGNIGTALASGPFITRNGTGAIQMNYVLGHHDAGDHDSRLSSHFRMYYHQLDFYDHWKDAAETTNWNIPKVEELYPSDTTYAGTSVLPDCMQQALWVVRSYIQGIDASGGARGGSNHASVGAPSWALTSEVGSTSYVMYNYSPDHLTSYIMAILLAKTAIALRKHGSFETLAQYMEDKATLCYNRFTLIHDKIPGSRRGTYWGSHSTPAVNTARLEMYDAYKTACNSLEPLAFETMFNAHMAEFIDFRLFAAAIFMYRMTGDEAYHTTALEYYNGLSAGEKTALINNGIVLVAYYEYSNTDHAGVDGTLQSTWSAQIKSVTTTNFYNVNAGAVGFRSHKAYNTNASYGQNGCSWAQWDTPVIAAYQISERETPGSGANYLKQMQYAFQYILGCNILKRSYVTGTGIDTPEAALHTDSHMDGRLPPKGYCYYGPSNREFGGSLIFEANQPLNWVTSNNSEDITADFNHEKEVYPTRYALPLDAHFFSIWGATDMSEYVIGGSVGPQQAFAATLYAALSDGETTLSTAVPAGKTRATARTQGTRLSIQSLTPSGPFKVNGVLACDTDDTNVYWVATTSATKPSQAQVIAGQNHTGAAAIASGSFAMDNQTGFAYQFTDLDAETLTYFHLVSVDASGVGAPAVTGSATTGEYVSFAVTYRAGADDTTNDTGAITPYSFTNGGSHYAIGTANAQRKVVVGTMTRWGTNTNITPTSVLIKPTGESDVTGVLVVGKNFDGSAGGHNFVGLYEGLTIAGTTADYEVTWNNLALRCSIDTWTVSGAQPTPVGYSNRVQGTHTVIETTVTIPAGGVAICLVQGISGSPSGVTWTANGSSSGVTEDSDELVFGSSWRSAARVTTAGTVTIRATFTGNVTDSGLVIVVYEPY